MNAILQQHFANLQRAQQQAQRAVASLGGWAGYAGAISAAQANPLPGTYGSLAGLQALTYVFGQHIGQDVIRNGDAAGNDQVVFTADSGSKAQHLWFSRKGSDLEVTVLDSNKSTSVVSVNGSQSVQSHGPQDKLTLSNWYGSADARVDSFRDAAGHTLKASQVDNLVNAMAAFGATPAGSESLTQQQWKQLEPVIAANWA